MKERLEAIRERALAQINETDSLDKLISESLSLERRVNLQKYLKV